MESLQCLSVDSQCGGFNMIFLIVIVASAPFGPGLRAGGPGSLS